MSYAELHFKSALCKPFPEKEVLGFWLKGAVGAMEFNHKILVGMQMKAFLMDGWLSSFYMNTSREGELNLSPGN